MFKFKTLTAALLFRDRADKMMRIFMIEDETLAVVTMVEGERLLMAGYEEIHNSCTLSSTKWQQHIARLS